MLKVLLVVIVVGLAVYATVRLLQRDNQLPAVRRRSRPPQRPHGPDDDDDFLRDLDRRRLHPEDPDT